MLLRRVATVVAATIALSGISAVALPTFVLPQAVGQSPTTAPTPRLKQSPAPSGWLQELNLTPQQVQQIKAIRNQSKNQLSQQRQAVRQAQQDLEALMAGSAPKDKVRDKYNQLKNLRQQLSDTQFENTLAIREILNTEQRHKFTELMYKK
jgi:Spy/CpxP family protein refolding chaperone